MLIVLGSLIVWVILFPKSKDSKASESRMDAKDQSSKTTTLSIVRERYEKGEITKEQFEQMIKDL